MSQALIMIEQLIKGLKADRVQQVLLSELVTLKKQLAHELNEITLDKCSINNKPSLRAVRMSLFPVADSLQSVVDLTNSHLPIIDKNVVLNLLMTYHNTLLKELECQSQSK